MCTSHLRDIKKPTSFALFYLLEATGENYSRINSTVLMHKTKSLYPFKKREKNTSKRVEVGDIQWCQQQEVGVYSLERLPLIIPWARDRDC